VRRGQDERTTENRDKRATNGGVKRGDKSTLSKKRTPKKKKRTLRSANAGSFLMPLSSCMADAKEPREEEALVAEVFDDAH
jgi:hypothetical protein